VFAVVNDFDREDIEEDVNRGICFVDVTLKGVHGVGGGGGTPRKMGGGGGPPSQNPYPHRRRRWLVSEHQFLPLPHLRRKSAIFLTQFMT